MPTLQAGLSQQSEVMFNSCSPSAAGPTLSAVMGLLSYLGWRWAAVLRKVSLCSFFFTFVSKVMLLWKFLVAAAMFPLASGCQMLQRLY